MAALFVLAMACGRSEILPIGSTDFGVAGAESPGGRGGGAGMTSAGTGGGTARGGTGGTTTPRGGSAGKASGGRAGAGAGGGAGELGGAGFGGLSGFAGAMRGIAGMTAACGDGVVQGDEECDDGNDVNTDDCLRSCQVPTCGDGVIWDAHEECDDENTTSGDGCSASCRFEVETVVAGDEATCAMSRGAVKCWGRGSAGQLGLGDSASRGDGPGEMGDALPSVPLGNEALAIQLSGGASHFCALLNFGVKCWGFNGDGELGLGDTEWRGDQPGEMGDYLPLVDIAEGADETAVSAGYNSTCALYHPVDPHQYKKLKCWGANQAGQLGQGDTSYRGDEPGDMGDALDPVDLATTEDLAHVSVGKSHTCVVDLGGFVRCWGDDQYGKLGLGRTGAVGDNPDEMGASLPPVDVGTWYVANIGAGTDHTCALGIDGEVKCWGRNDEGQLGLGDLDGRGLSPSDMGDLLPFVQLGTDLVATALSVGAHHTCALLNNQTVKCWGQNDHGQLGYGDTLPRGGEPGTMGDSLNAVDLGQAALQVSAAGDHTCALLADRTVRCWGDNAHGELGLGDIETRGDEPGEMGEDLPPVDVGF